MSTADLLRLTAALDPEPIAELATRMLEIWSPPGAEVEMAALAHRALIAAGAEDATIDDEFPASPSVIAWLRGQEPGPTIQWHGHLDAISAPQGPVRREADVIYGRGAADMKGALAAEIEAVKLLRAAAPVRDAGRAHAQHVCACLLQEGRKEGSLVHGVRGRDRHAADPECPKCLNEGERRADRGNPGRRRQLARLLPRALQAEDEAAGRARPQHGGDATRCAVFPQLADPVQQPPHLAGPAGVLDRVGVLVHRGVRHDHTERRPDTVGQPDVVVLGGMARVEDAEGRHCAPDSARLPPRTGGCVLRRWRHCPTIARRPRTGGAAAMR